MDMIKDDWIEIEGRNKDEALERACNALNTTLSYLDYELINPSGSKIRARKSEAPKAAKVVTDMPMPKIIFKKADRAEKTSDTEVASEDQPPREVTKISIRPQPVEKEKPLVFLSEPTELGVKSREILEQILSHIAEEASVALTETEEEIHLEIKSNGSGLFIGKHGQTLEAFQHVVAKMLGLDRNSSRRLILDSEGYRSRREDSLQNLAHRIAGRVGKMRKPMTLEPMGAMDRRIIHLALAEHPHVSTKSIGEGMERKIVVTPKGGYAPTRGARGDSGGRGGRGNFREGRGRDRNHERSPGGPKKAQLVTRSRLHDSYDVPASPNMAIFPEDIDELMDLPEDQMQERLSMMRSSGEE